MRVPNSPRTVLRALFLASLSLVAVVTASLSGQTAAPTPLDGFDPNANGVVTKVLLQPDGKLLVAGYFTQLQPNGAAAATGESYIARINTDGTLDTTFAANVDGAIYNAALLSSGKILIGGVFKNVGGVAQVGAARLNADGSLDTGFRPVISGQFGVQVYAVAGQADGKVLVGGAFNTANGTTRNRIARFNSDGSLDTTYDPNANSTVNAIAIQTDGKAVIGGAFTLLTANGAPQATRSYIARLNTDGSVDLSYDPEANASVSTIVIAPNGQALLGGSFTNMTPNGASTSTQIDYFARINTDGTLDSSFILNPSGKVLGITLQADGKMLLEGNFQVVEPVESTASTTAPYLVRINTDGSADPNFHPNPNYTCTSAVVQSNGQIVVGGYFTAVQPTGSPGATTRNYVARINTDGSLDATFSPDSVGRILASAVDSSGKVIIGGTFTSIGGVTANYLARLDTAGNLDKTFLPVLNGVVDGIVVQSDGKIVIGGNFTTVNTTPRHYIARLNAADGSVDTTYDPNANSSVYSMHLQSDGKILVGGTFTSFNVNNSATNYAASTTTTDVTTLMTRSYIARINTDGTTDTTFFPTFDNAVFSIQQQSDGSIITGGSFTTIFGYHDVYTQSRTYIARLKTDGTVDEQTFNPSANGPVYSVAIQSDDQIILGGAFSAFTPALLGSSATTVTPTTYARLHVARLAKDGSLDKSYDPEANSTVLQVAIQPNTSNQVLVGGNFTNLAPTLTTTDSKGVATTTAQTSVTRSNLARLKTDGTVDTTFTAGTNAQVGNITTTSGSTFYIGGNFTSVTPTGSSTPVARSHFARLAADGSLDTSFNVGAVVANGGSITALALQPDGEILVGGAFSALGGATSANLVRFNSAGYADNTFNPNPDGAVNTVTVPSAGAATPSASSFSAWLNADGSIKTTFVSGANGQVTSYAKQAIPGGKTYLLVGGLFNTSFGSNAGSANIARFNLDGTPDTNFNPVVVGEVLSIVVQTDGKILIGGDFTTVGGNALTYCARLNTDGSTDTTFQPQPNAEVHAIYLQSDGNIVIGGSFTALTPTGSTSATTREYMARLTTAGALDTAYNPNLNGEVFTIVPQSDGHVLIGGAFTAIQPNGKGTSNIVGYCARLNSDGTYDSSFNPIANNTVFTIGILPNAKIILGGLFTSLEPGSTTATVYTRNELAVVNQADASIDTTWSTSANSTVESLSVQGDGKVIVGGLFTTLQAQSDTNPVTRNHVARLNLDGTIDSSFDPNANGTVQATYINSDGTILIGGLFTQLQPNGALVVGGSFQNIGGANLPYLARISIDGATDTSFTPKPNGPVNAAVIQNDGKLVVGGSFTSLGSTAQANLGRVSGINGAIDTAYAPVVDGSVVSEALQSDGKVIIGGNFTHVNGVSANHIARLTTAGALDGTFTGNSNAVVNAITLTASGQILVGGSFTSIGGGAVANFARLTTAGTIDGTFAPNVNGPVNSVALAADGSMIIGGNFTTVGGAARLNVARLTANGTVDAVYKADANLPVNTVVLQSDGKALFGGTFNTLAGLSRNLFGRLTSASAATQTLGVSADGSTITWTRGGSSPELASVLFEQSTDATTWTAVGVGTRIAGTPSWTLSGASSPASSYYLRARGVVPSNEFGSAGLIETVQTASAGTNSIKSSLNVVATLKAAFGLTVVTSTPTTPTVYTSTTLPAGLSLNASTGIISGTATAAGVYPVTVTATTATATTASSFAITVTPYASTGLPPLARIPAVTSQAYLGTADTLKTGFTVSGSGSTSVLLSGAGPTLVNFGVTSPIASPKIVFSDSVGNVISSNAGIGTDIASLSATADELGAIPLTATDSALTASTGVGSYSVEVSDQSGLGGLAVSQVVNASNSYLLDPNWISSHTTQATVYPGASGTVIVAFNVGGTKAARLLIRGVGPGLASRGVANGLSDPSLSLYDANGTLIAQNTGWTSQAVATSSALLSSNAAEVSYAASTAGAYPLIATNEDDAIVVTLSPGIYSIQIASKGGNTGAVSAEIYQF